MFGNRQFAFFNLRLFALLVVAMIILFGSGCRPSFQATEEAISLPLDQKDPLENNRDLARWPAWRGKNGAGIAPGGSPAIYFSGTQGFRWKQQVPGSGNSSPVVWDNFVLLTSAIKYSEEPTLAILCFDRSDGKQLWQYEVGKARGETHVKNGYASASVATDGQRIFAFFGSTGLCCCDFDGKQLWKAELGELEHRFGTASSPVLFGKTVIQVCDSDEDSYIAAFDKMTGNRVWRTERPSNGCWSTPVFVDVQDGSAHRTEMVVNGTEDSSGEGWIIAYDPSDGRELWRVRGTTKWVTPLPLVGNGLVYCMSGRNGPIEAIKPGGTGDVTDSRVIWRHNTGGPYIPSGLAYRNRLFVLSDEKWVVCYNIGNGERLWSANLGGPYSASLVAADGRIYAVNENGRVSVFAAADSFKLLAQNDLGTRCLATPAIAEGELLIRTETDLYCFPVLSRENTAGQAGSTTPAEATIGQADSINPTGSATQSGAGSPSGKVIMTPGRAPLRIEDVAGPANQAPADAWPMFRGNTQSTGVSAAILPEKLKRLWSFSAGKGEFLSTPAVADGTVFIGDSKKILHALDLQGGGIRWEFSASGGFIASPAVRDGHVFIGDIDGRFHCIDARTGGEKWHFDADGEIDSSANFHQDKVLFGSTDTNLYCLKADTGELAWKFDASEYIFSSPTVAGDRAFVACCDGFLHAIDLATGNSISEVELNGATGCTAAVLGDGLFVGTEENDFLAIDWKGAKVVWRFTSPRRGAGFRYSAAPSPAVAPQVVIVTSSEREVRAFNPRTGQPLWSFTAGSRVDSSPVIVGGRVFVASTDGCLYALDLNSGNEKWRFELGGSVAGSPAVASGRLLIGTDNGELHCFGGE
jgi:outer membrane protein assembly factor BamB